MGIEARPGGCVWLWLEEVRDEYGGRWPLARYGLAARHLGRFNGAGLGRGTAAVEAPWLARDWLRRFTALRSREARWHLLDQDTTWRHPLVRRAFPCPVRAQAVRLRHLTAPLLDALDRLPQTLCHQDAYSRNLLSRRGAAGEEETVAVDWAFVGRAALGTEAGNLFAATAVFHDVPSSDYVRFAELVSQGYLEGLTDAGWAGDWRQVRLGYLGALLARWGWAVPAVLAVALDEPSHAALEAARGRPMAELMDEWGRFVSAQFDALDEAEALLGAL